ncbi:Sts1 protein [Saccharomycopsis crataegensis]|uniref:Tethering factor for nuclear proteasome STS1 n=1 Tax=Saccharomycopsis crataegensis TaxID=43959 RepID=A0AAV5QEY9_9ASCO|nr:Sts1 protein [Saccharomycopsis crataegensis]
MSNLGFSWDFEPKFATTQQQDELTKKQQHLINSKKHTPRKLKRRIRDDEPQLYKPSSYSNNTVRNRPVITKSFNKRSKTQEHVTGRPLPLFRVIELLDKKQLSSMILGLIDEKPELNQVIYNNMAHRFDSLINPSVDKSVEYLRNFLEERILAKLPYKVEPESEYCFLRVQKPLIEFYTILSDFILNYVPPREDNFVNCLKFLDEATMLVHRIPFFKINSFNMYHYTNIYDRLVNAWWTVIRHFIGSPADDEAEFQFSKIQTSPLTSSETDLNIFHMVEYSLPDRLKYHQSTCQCDRFDRLVEFVGVKIDSYHLSNIDLQSNSIAHDLFAPHNTNNQQQEQQEQQYNGAGTLQQQGNTSKTLSANFSGNNNPVGNGYTYNPAIMDGSSFR